MSGNDFLSLSKSIFLYEKGKSTASPDPTADATVWVGATNFSTNAPLAIIGVIFGDSRVHPGIGEENKLEIPRIMLQ
jgi:hypothetical protein